jgi:hypothetical protein
MDISYRLRIFIIGGFVESDEPALLLHLLGLERSPRAHTPDNNFQIS